MSEKKNLSKINSATLFRKLQEHELELGRLENHKDQEKKHTKIALRVEPKEKMQDNGSDKEENITLLTQSFGKFLQKDKTIRFEKGRYFFKKREASTSN